MSSKEYGSYNFREGFKIEEGNFKNLLPTSIIKHESTHYKSFVFSIFGTFYRMWSKLLDHPGLRRSKPLFDHLHKYFSKMQEQAATYNEIVDELSKLDESEYDDYLKKFRYSNKKYYNYFDAMRRNSNGVLGTLHIKQINATKNTDKLHELIDRILFLSFSIDIKQFSFEKWQKITDIDSDMTTNEQLNPNKRFQMILNNLIYDSQRNCITLDIESLNETLKIANSSDYNSLDAYYQIFERLLGKKYSLDMLMLISKSGVETDESIFKDEVLMAYPSLPIFRPTENLFLNPIKLLDANNILDQKENYKYAQIITQNYFTSWAINLINETKMVIIQDVNEMLSAMILLNQLIKQFDLTVTTSSKLSFEILDRIEYDVFVFMTRPISENLKYINDEYRDGYYNIVKNDDVNLLLVKKNRIILIQPLIASQIDLVKSRLDQIANKNFLMFLSSKALESIDLYFMDRQLNADDKMINKFFSNFDKAKDEYLRLRNT